VAKVSRDPEKIRPFKPADFDPYASGDRRDEVIELKDMAELKDAFVGHPKRILGTIQGPVGPRQTQSRH